MNSTKTLVTLTVVAFATFMFFSIMIMTSDVFFESAHFFHYENIKTEPLSYTHYRANNIDIAPDCPELDDSYVYIRVATHEVFLRGLDMFIEHAEAYDNMLHSQSMYILQIVKEYFEEHSTLIPVRGDTLGDPIPGSIRVFSFEEAREYVEMLIRERESRTE